MRRSKMHTVMVWSLAGVVGMGSWNALWASDGPSSEALLDPAVTVAMSEPQPAGAWWDQWLQDAQFRGELRQETAYRVANSSEWTKVRQQLLLTESHRFNDQLSMRSTQRAWYDGVFDLTDNYPETVESNQEWELELRDTYLDYSDGPLDVRLGKQQVVWGDAVGLFFADIVNAKDLREFVLPDFDLIRIPQWALDLEYSADPIHAEFVWLPVRQFHKLGVSGSEFEFSLPAPPGSPTTYADPSKPPSSFDNSEVGLRLASLLNGWDTSLFYLYGWDKFPVLFRAISGGVYNFSPTYQRAHFLGGSFSKALRDVVFKGELLVTPHAALSTYDTGDSDGVVQRATVDYLVGADYTFCDTLETNVQLMQHVVTNHDILLAGEDRSRTHVSLRLKTEWLGGKVEPEFLIITRLSEEDLLLRPKVTMNLTDRLQWRVGADIFRGEPASGVFGRFNDASRVYSELSYHF